MVPGGGMPPPYIFGTVRFISHNLFYNGATKEGCPMQWILLIQAAVLQLQNP